MRDHEIRKSEYDRKSHWENHHLDRLDRGEKPSSKLPAKGSESLDIIVVEKKKSDNADKEEEETGYDVKEDVLQAETLEAPKRHLCETEISHENENPPKRLKNEEVALSMRKKTLENGLSYKVYRVIN